MKPWEHSAAIRAKQIDYRRKVSMPIRDMQRGGAVAFVVDVYGIEPKDLAIIPGGAEPMLKAVKRIGLDPYRFTTTPWDIPL